MVPNDPVDHPKHYTWISGLEVIDITERLNFCLGNAIKYILRCDYKGAPIQDLEKACWYLRREIARRKRPSPPLPKTEPNAWVESPSTSPNPTEETWVEPPDEYVPCV